MTLFDVFYLEYRNPLALAINITGDHLFKLTIVRQAFFQRGIQFGIDRLKKSDLFIHYNFAWLELTGPEGVKDFIKQEIEY